MRGAVVVLAVPLAVMVWLAPPPAAGLRYTHSLRMTAHMKEMGGGGDALIDMRFTTGGLCKSFRRAIWSQLPDLDGELGDCAEIGK